MKSPAQDAGKKAAAALSRGRLREALLAAADGLRLDPSLSVLHALRGEILRRMGARRRGLESLEAALRTPGAEQAARLFPEAGWAWAVEGRRLRLKDDLRGAELALEKAVALDGTLGAAWGWLGEVRLRQNEPLRAWRCLFEAEINFPDWPELFLWRGETLASQGRHAEAARAFTRAVDSGELGARALELRARARKSAGDAAGARADAAAVARLSRAAAVDAKTAEARSLAERGKEAAALSLLSSAIRADPGDSRLHFARAELQARLKKFDLARADLNRAVALDPGVDSFTRRGDFLNGYGVPMESVDDYTQALALRPSAPLFLRRARLFFGHRQFAHAFEDFARAAAAAPDWAEAFEARADALLSLNRAEEALADTALAAALEPGRPALRLKHAQALALAGKTEAALRELKAAEAQGAEPAAAGVERGLALGLARRYDQAQAELSRARKAPALSLEARTRASLFAAACAAAAAARRAKKPARRGRVLLAGLGVAPPGTITVQTLEALAGCDVVFRNASGANIMELLRLLCPDCRPVQFRYEQDARRTSEMLLAEARKGRSVAFVTFGNPMVCGPLGDEVLRRAKEEGIATAVTGAVSSIDAMLAGAAGELGPGGGAYQVLIPTGPSLATAQANPAVPVLLYFPGPGREWEAFLARFLAAYPPGHEGRLFDPHNEQWASRGRAIKLRELKTLSPQLMQQTMLLVPPVRRRD